MGYCFAISIKRGCKLRLALIHGGADPKPGGTGAQGSKPPPAEHQLGADFVYMRTCTARV